MPQKIAVAHPSYRGRPYGTIVVAFYLDSKIGLLEARVLGNIVLLASWAYHDVHDMNVCVRLPNARLSKRRRGRSVHCAMAMS